ncbi:S1C family serine protease [Caproiciproducens faecalis]|uniref:Trypsin-like peptidase domain-containing protein n=1 Tax=Caproiciproducens faecalis TaxID=2820301 RepID=A0ABS7DNP0_9FIRM|nr:trypsin-like peptidase domain-containing protein [Caproiciproducens faecalis]MBW7572729.1 trypsin-like peptidase domain-containing protein [Caproiciproducens faecalis]
MSDSDFDHNHNGEQNPWDNDSANQSGEEHPTAPEQENEPEQPALPQDTPEAPLEQEEAPAAPGAEPDSRDADRPVPPYGQPPYQDSQNPYSPYGQYNNPYGQYQQPYGNYNNPYGNYQQNPYGQQPYWSYQQNGGQQPGQNPQDPRPPKRKNTGLRVFLWILGGLTAAFVLGFCIYGVQTAVAQQNGGWPQTTTSQPENNESEAPATSGSESSQAQIQGGIKGNGTNPNSAGITIVPEPGTGVLSAKDVYKNVVESVVGVETTVAGTTDAKGGVIQGTGIVASVDGYILTNAHVVNYSRANKVKVILHDKKEYEATVVGYDKTSDLAVLRINANNLSAAVFGNADQLEIGDEVIAIGNPGGMEYSSSLTGGYVSALNRTIESHSDNGMTYIQTDAAINPGNSGGPLVNMYGQVIGINSNKIVATGYEGMGFAIPVSKAKTIIDDLVARGYVTGRSRLGITATTITDIQSQLSGYPTGVMIREISSESDLTKSGVAVGDVITKADGQTISSLDDLYAVLNRHKAGDTLSLTIFRMGTGQSTGSSKTVKTKLLEDKGETQAK